MAHVGASVKLVKMAPLLSHGSIFTLPREPVGGFPALLLSAIKRCPAGRRIHLLAGTRVPATAPDLPSGRSLRRPRKEKLVPALLCWVSPFCLSLL